MKKTSYYFVFVFVIFVTVSCKKDYQKLSTEFIRNLPDSCELLAKIDSEQEHIVYYKDQNGKNFYCRDFENESNDTLSPKISDGLEIKEILAGKENIMVCASQFDVEVQLVEVYLYNFETRKFKRIGDFENYENDSTACSICFYSSIEMPKQYKNIIKAQTFDYDGNLLHEEENEVDIPDYKDGESEVDYYNRLADEEQANRLSLWECILCHDRVPSKGKPAKGGCPDLFGHDWRRISYLE